MPKRVVWATTLAKNPSRRKGFCTENLNAKTDRIAGGGAQTSMLSGRVKRHAKKRKHFCHRA